MKHYTRQDFENMSKSELARKLITRHAKITELNAHLASQTLSFHMGVPKQSNYPTLAVLAFAHGVALSFASPVLFNKYMRKDKDQLVEECWQAQQKLEDLRKEKISKMNTEDLIKNIQATLLRIAYLQKNLDVNLVPARFHTRDKDGRTLIDIKELKSADVEREVNKGQSIQIHRLGSSSDELFRIYDNLRSVLRAERAKLKDTPSNKVLKGSSSWPMTPGQLAIAKDHILNSVAAWAETGHNWHNTWHDQEAMRIAEQTRFVDIVREISSLSETPDLDDAVFLNAVANFTANFDKSVLDTILNIFAVQRTASVHLNQYGSPYQYNEKKSKVMLDEFVKNFGLPALQAATDTFATLLAQRPALEIQTPPIQRFLAEHGLEANGKVIKHTQSGYSEEIDDLFICPISQDLMIDPVSNSVGHTYERKEIESALTYKKADPMTNEACTDVLAPNISIRKAILVFLEKFVAAAEATQQPGHDRPRIR